jgi:hypothetical protein
MVDVKGLPPGWAKKNNVMSGETTMYAPDSDIDDDTDELIIPEGASIEVSSSGAPIIVLLYFTFASHIVD